MQCILGIIRKTVQKQYSMISLFLDINAHIPCTWNMHHIEKKRCTLYLDLREPRNTTNLIIWYRDVEKRIVSGYLSSALHVCLPRAVKNP